MGKSENVKPSTEQIGKLREMFLSKMQEEKPSCGGKFKVQWGSLFIIVD